MTELAVVLTVGGLAFVGVAVVGYLLFRKWMLSEERKAKNFRDLHRD
ncbi:MAG TPA: hypothetical protein VGE01_10615 [Fimbriimonas sp.]